MRLQSEPSPDGAVISSSFSLSVCNRTYLSRVFMVLIRPVIFPKVSGGVFLNLYRSDLDGILSGALGILLGVEEQR